MAVVVEALDRHPALVQVVAGWHWHEWGHTDPAGSVETWAAGLPVCLVRQDMPGYPPAAGLAPWLKGLYVTPAARRQGHGAVLVRRCEAWARSLGYEALYLYTERGSGGQALYESLNWRAIGMGHYEGTDVTVMRTAL